MDPKIRYLSQLEDDLRNAAERERHLAPAIEPRRRRRDMPWGAVAASVVALLVVAGSIGWLSNRSSEQASTAGSGKSAPLANASGVPNTAPHLPAPNSEKDALGAGRIFKGNESSGGGGGSGTTSETDSSSSASLYLSKIIRTGSMSVTVPRGQLPKAVDQVTAVADSQKGFVFSSSVGEHAGNLVLHVPAKHFDRAITALRHVGTVKDVTVSAQDVTSQYVDLQARLDISQGRFKVLFGLYSKASTIQQTLQIQNALDDTQLRIEQIQGQLNVLNDRTSESTIRVTLNEQGAPATVHGDTVKNPSVGTAWRRSVAGFFGVISAVVVGLGYLVPLGTFALLIWLVVTLARRRRRGATPTP